jgi:hypothetical protein
VGNREATVKVTLIGGMDRLEPHYLREASRAGHELKIFSQYVSGLEAKIGTTEAVVLFTGKVSHQARNHALEAARNLGVPVYQSHSCGVSSLRECLAAL